MFFPVGGDPYWNSVALHLPGMGENNSTAIYDRSPSIKTVSRVGDTKISTTQSKWGQGSLYVDGTGDYININSTSDLSFGTGDFTIESWVYVTGTAIVFIFNNSDAASTGADGFSATIRATSSSSVIRFFDYKTNTGHNGTTSVSLNAWEHIAFTRQSGTFRGFLNGLVEIGPSTINTDFSDQAYPRIAAAPGSTPGSVSASCYFQNLRITKGVARYTAAFNTSLPTEPFPERPNDLQVQTFSQPSFRQIARLGL